MMPAPGSVVKHLGFGLAVLCLVFGMSACGKKSRPIPPDGATYPREYPKPQ
jgi:hypothetical protein